MMIQDQDTYTNKENIAYDYYLKKIGESTYWIWKQRRSINYTEILNLCEMKIALTNIQIPPLSSALNVSEFKTEIKTILQPLFFFIVENLNETGPYVTDRKYNIRSSSSFPTIWIGSNTQEQDETNPIVKAYREYIATYYNKKGVTNETPKT